VADQDDQKPIWHGWLPPLRWLAEYRASWLRGDIVAGITLAAYAIPVSLAYAALAGLPPQVGIYGYLLGGLGYALLGSSRQLAIGPTSAISLMIAGTVGAMADGDAQRYAQIASLTAFTVALLCLIAWLLRLSALVKLISDSILVGFKAGAGLTIAMTQLPGLFGVKGGGHNFFERAYLLAGQLTQIQTLVLAVGLIAILLIVFGERLLPGKPVALGVVGLAIAAATLLGLPSLGVPTTGEIPSGLPTLAGPALRLRDVEGIVPLAAGCLLLAYIESVSAARTFAAKHGYALDPRQELLGIGAANLAAAMGHGYPVAGGLSQSAVNDKAGACSPLALVFASITLALCLLFLTGLLADLPKAVLAAIVLTAIYGLLDFPAMFRMWRVSRLDFYAATIALVAVLLLGILQGILLAALASQRQRPQLADRAGIEPGRGARPDTDAGPEVLVGRLQRFVAYEAGQAGICGDARQRHRLDGAGHRLKNLRHGRRERLVFQRVLLVAADKEERFGVGLGVKHAGQPVLGYIRLTRHAVGADVEEPDGQPGHLAGVGTVDEPQCPADALVDAVQARP
jgi:MFS superfamily sulfate permease-like transporter